MKQIQEDLLESQSQYTACYNEVGALFVTTKIGARLQLHVCQASHPLAFFLI